MKPIYLICGESNLKNNESLNKIIKECEYEYEIDYHDMEEESLAVLIESLNIIPFLSSHKIVVAKYPKFFYKTSSYDPKLIEAFINYLHNPSISTTFIIITNTLKDIDSKIKQALDSCACYIMQDENNDTDIKTKIINTLKFEGFNYDEDAILELIQRCEKNKDRIDMELSKLILYKNEEKYLNILDVKELVSKELDDNIFDLVNAVVDSNRRRAIEIYNDLMTLNEDESRIIALLINKFNEMYQTKSLLLKGFGKNEIAQVFNVKPGRAYYMIKNCEGISLERIKKNVNALVDIDFKIKSGQLDKSIALELFLLK